MASQEWFKTLRVIKTSRGGGKESNKDTNKQHDEQAEGGSPQDVVDFICIM